MFLGTMAVLSGCTTTSGSDRLDETGEKIADASTEPESSAYYIEALKGGLMSRISGATFSASDRARGLEAEYKALEATPIGLPVAWTGSGGIRGEVVAAVPYQVGSQNCRQYSHSVTAGGVQRVAKGAACRNPNGSWTPLI